MTFQNQKPDPKTDPAFPYESLGSRKLDDSAEGVLDHYLKPSAFIMFSTYKPEPIYLANPKYNTESLLANASETLGSASKMFNNFTATLDTLAPQDCAGYRAGGHAWRTGGESGTGSR